MTVNERIKLRRQYAGQALQGLLADPEDHADECIANESCERAVARLALCHADALVDAVERRETAEAGYSKN